MIFMFGFVNLGRTTNENKNEIITTNIDSYSFGHDTPHANSIFLNLLSFTQLI